MTAPGLSLALSLASESLQKIEPEWRRMRRAARKFVDWYETEHSGTEGSYPIEPDIGCVACTLGVTPDRYNTGLCMYHACKELLRDEVPNSEAMSRIVATIADCAESAKGEK